MNCDLISLFVNLTGSSTDEAEMWLECCQFDVEQAVNMYFSNDQKGNSAPNHMNTFSSAAFINHCSGALANMFKPNEKLTFRYGWHIISYTAVKLLLFTLLH